MNGKLQQIRKKLYLHRDGASSSSMREKGIQYKINFGVSILTLRQIAKDYFPDDNLADELWQNDNRELKILATLIQDPLTFTHANEWVGQVTNIELAEQIALNLLCKLPHAINYAQKWVISNQQYIKLTGFLLYTRLFINNYIMEEREDKSFFLSVADALNSDSLLIRNVAFNSLKHLGKQSVIKSKTVLAMIKDNDYISQEMRENLYDDLTFEFEHLT